MNVNQQPKTLSERADELEHQMEEELERIVTKSLLFNLADGKVGYDSSAALQAKYPGKYMLMGDDPRLPKMPAKPTLLDYFHYRFASMNHLLQSATHALKAGLPEKVILACLLHDIGVCRLHPRRPRLLGRADDRALCRRGGELGDPRAPGAALLPRRVGRLQVSRTCM